MNKCYALVWNVSQGCWNVVSECGEVTVLTHAKRGMDRLEPL